MIDFLLLFELAYFVFRKAYSQNVTCIHQACPSKRFYYVCIFFIMHVRPWVTEYTWYNRRDKGSWIKCFSCTCNRIHMVQNTFFWLSLINLVLNLMNQWKACVQHCDSPVNDCSAAFCLGLFGVYCPHFDSSRGMGLWVAHFWDICVLKKSQFIKVQVYIFVLSALILTIYTLLYAALHFFLSHGISLRSLRWKIHICSLTSGYFSRMLFVLSH